MNSFDLWVQVFGSEGIVRLAPRAMAVKCPCCESKMKTLHVFHPDAALAVRMKCGVCGAVGLDVCRALGLSSDWLNWREAIDDNAQVRKEPETKKPPLGIEPRYIWEEKRRQKIRKAITEYMNADLMVPESWIEEWNELTSGGKEDLIGEQLED